MEPDESDWTNKMEDRLASLTGPLEAIAEDEDEDSETDPILPVVDPDYPTSPKKDPQERFIRKPNDGEREDWTLGMIGAGLLFLYAASYMN